MSIEKYIGEQMYCRRLVIAMAIADITITELAAEAGVNRSSIYHYRIGEADPRPDIREKIADVIGERVPMLRRFLEEI